MKDVSFLFLFWAYRQFVTVPVEWTTHHTPAFSVTFLVLVYFHFSPNATIIHRNIHSFYFFPFPSSHLPSIILLPPASLFTPYVSCATTHCSLCVSLAWYKDHTPLTYSFFSLNNGSLSLIVKAPSLTLNAPPPPSSTSVHIILASLFFSFLSLLPPAVYLYSSTTTRIVATSSRIKF
jgi:hypothetical protein